MSNNSKGEIELLLFFAITFLLLCIRIIYPKEPKKKKGGKNKCEIDLNTHTPISCEQKKREIGNDEK